MSITSEQDVYLASSTLLYYGPGTGGSLTVSASSSDPLVQGYKGGTHIGLIRTGQPADPRGTESPEISEISKISEIRCVQLVKMGTKRSLQASYTCQHPEQLSDEIGRKMAKIQKRSIPVIVLLLLATACSPTISTQEPSQIPEVPSPPAEIDPNPTDMLPTTSAATDTLEPVLEPTLAPSSTAPPLGGSGFILFASNREGVYSDLYLLDAGSGEVTRLTNVDSNTFPGPFSPDGTRILFTGFGLTHSYVGLANADGSQPVDLSQSPDSDEGFPTWSPDGTQVAFTSRRDGNNEIYMMSADGSNPTRLTFNERDDFSPAWSPDGTQIAFVSDRDNDLGINNLYIMNADGSGVRRLTSGSEIDYAPAWSPDGQRIAYRSHREGAADIYVINADGSDLLNLTDNPAEDWAPAWSPDGSLIAFQSDRDGNWEIYVMRADGSQAQNLTQNPADDEMPYWRP